MNNSIVPKIPLARGIFFWYNNKVKECFGFFVSRIATLLMDAGTMFLLVTIIEMNDKIAKLIVQVIVTIGNYILSKYFVFNTKEK